MISKENLIKNQKQKNLLTLITISISFFILSIYIIVSPTSFETIKNSFKFIPGQWKNEFKNVWSLPYSQENARLSIGMSNSPEDLIKFTTKSKDDYFYPPTFSYANNTAPRAKAGFIVLVRNRELNELRNAMRDVEYRFNRKYGYPWIFLNDEPFTEEFKRGVRQITRSEIRFGEIPKEQWSYPDHINQTLASENRKKMEKAGVFYGGSESYRHMCRFQSGFFFRHPLVQDLDYYWRVEPGIQITCDLDYDPFLFMQMNNKTYGFTVAMHEYGNSVETLWKTTQKFIQKNPTFVDKDSALRFLINNAEPHTKINSSHDLVSTITQNDWNMCHFWSNFEIADLRLWKDEKYLAFFDFLDQAGGFFYERWGDAPIHSLAASMFQSQSKIHHFDDIGYWHAPRGRCPTSPEYHGNGRCDCNPKESYDIAQDSCLKDWWAASTENHRAFAIP